MCRFILLCCAALSLAAQQNPDGTFRVGGGVGGPQRPPQPQARQQQPQPQAAEPVNPQDLGAIEGQVVDALTGEPLRNATITATKTDVTPGGGPPPSFSTKSDGAGNFAFQDVDPGTYRLMANRNGYVIAYYGAKAPMRVGTMLPVAKQQHVRNTNFKLTPQGVITGRIVDEDGEPVPYVMVTLQTYRYMQGRKRLVSGGGSATTNDLGEYRIFGVAPGKYFLSATPRPPMQMNPVNRSTNADEDYVATYYPGTLDQAGAAPVEITPGAQLKGIDMRLAKSRTVHVRGHVAGGAQSGRPDIQVYFTPRTTGFMGMMRPTFVDAAGNFDIRGVSPGSYTLTATAMDAGTRRQARTQVDVGTSNMEGINLVLGDGMTVRGRVRAESNDTGAPVDLTGVRVNLQPREMNVMFSGPMQTKAGDDDTFQITNVTADLYNVTVFGVPAGCYVKSIHTGRAEVLDSGLDLSSGAAPDMVEIVISPKAAAVTGTVTNPDSGNPAPGATVVLVPQEPERREEMTNYKMAVSDQNGSFQLKALRPGEYKAFAWEDIEAGAFMDPDFMKPVEGKGETVSLKESDQKSITLKSIPAGSAQ